MNEILEGIVQGDDKSAIESALSIHIALDALKISSDIGMLMHHQDSQALAELVELLDQLGVLAKSALDNLNAKMN
jgi:hypothetical protein